MRDASPPGIQSPSRRYTQQSQGNPGDSVSRSPCPLCPRRPRGLGHSLLWHDDGIARLQHDVLLGMLLLDDVVVVELVVVLVPVLAADDDDVLRVGVFEQTAAKR